MKYFDAQKRAKTYINSKNTKEIQKNILSKEYLKISVTERLDFFVNWLEEDFKGYDDAAAIKFIVNVEDTDENFLEDQDIFELMSNLSTAYSRTFPKQKEKVLSPKKNLLDSLPISPASIMSLTMLHIVNQPIQIIVNRNHKESDSFERVELI